ncbi:type II secretion system F family protein [Thiocystis violacea]|uniref:type II secretion system F family protein n=1 Tax=Thiocystis violacea TaxID=13725 RepID=UPI00190864AB|nr:type II secretion system F family protein [Thiocystis violacea]MBK1719248.1 hypothetical protein [Thiocystis violacea]
MIDWISSISAWPHTFSDDPERLRLLYSTMIGASAAGVVLALYFVITGVWNPLRQRVDSVKETAGLPARKSHPHGAVEKLGSLLMPKDASKRGRTETLLRYANLRSPGAVRVFYGIKFAGLVLSALLVLLVAALTPALAMGDALLYMLLASALGFLAPDILLPRLARRRQDRLRRGLPDAMDLLVVCSEAGMGLNSGIQRVASELIITHPDLADELALFSMQTRAGMDNRSALKDLEERTGLEDIQTLVAMLLQSMRFGTSIADTLRIYSDELRDKRLQRAQEKAARVSTLMLFPMIFCIFPSFFLVVLGPPILGAIKVLADIPALK